VFVDVHVMPGWAVASLAEDDEFLEQKDVAETSLAAVTDDELGLAQQLSLLVQVHLHQSVASRHRYTR